MTDKKEFDKWGYKAGEEPRIFQVSGDGQLPSGWHDTPQPDKPAKSEQHEDEPQQAPRRGPRRNDRVKDTDGDGE